MVENSPPQAAPLQGDGMKVLAETTNFMFTTMTMGLCVGLAQTLAHEVPTNILGLNKAAAPSPPAVAIAAPKAAPATAMRMSPPTLNMGAPGKR